MAKSSRARRHGDTKPTKAAKSRPAGGDLVPIESLIPDDRNARRHTARNREAIRQSLDEVGAARSIVLNGARKVLAGNGVLQEAKDAGFTHVRLVPSDGRTLIAVVRDNLTDEQETSLALFDNHTGDLAEWEPGILRALEGEGFPLSRIFQGDELSGILAAEGSAAAAAVRSDGPGSRADHQPETRQTDIQPGWVFDLGQHVLACGDSRDTELAARLLGDRKVPTVVSDPPYCSGGFQEANRGAGTWGDIAADNLSTRGFVALLTGTLETWRPQTAYLFTDWRMWIPLYDIAERVGLAVRSMIVWDKGTPGLGALWRTQHELVMFASRARNARLKGKPARGNVISGHHALDSEQAQTAERSAVIPAQRTGNKLHYTEKPVSLIEAILANDESSERGAGLVVDFFGGSGTTLMAAERRNRPALIVEVEPKFCQVAIDRWEGLTGRKAVRRA
ncbi:MAG: DNA modification methylase [Vicinamibacterales bacterium]